MEFLNQSLTILFVLAGAALIVLEAIIPGAHFIVLGVALFGAGVVGYALPLGAAGPLVMAGLTLVFGVAAYYVYSQYDFYGGDAEATKDSSSLEGLRGTVVSTVSASDGRVELDKPGFTSLYEARTSAGSLPEGTDIVVTDGGGGNVIEVEPAESDESDTDA